MLCPLCSLLLILYCSSSVVFMKYDLLETSIVLHGWAAQDCVDRCRLQHTSGVLPQSGPVCMSGRWWSAANARLHCNGLQPLVASTY